MLEEALATITRLFDFAIESKLCKASCQPRDYSPCARARLFASACSLAMSLDCPKSLDLNEFPIRLMAPSSWWCSRFIPPRRVDERSRFGDR
jgi:hypothetical protein